jgi:hypothetical protein
MDRFGWGSIRKVWVEPNKPCLDDPRRIKLRKQQRDLVCGPQTAFGLLASFHLAVGPTRDCLYVFDTCYISNQPPTQKALQVIGYVL